MIAANRKATIGINEYAILLNFMIAHAYEIATAHIHHTKVKKVFLNNVTKIFESKKRSWIFGPTSLSIALKAAL